MVTSVFIAGVLLIMFSGMLEFVASRALDQRPCEDQTRPNDLK